MKINKKIKLTDVFVAGPKGACFWLSRTIHAYF